MLRKTAKILFCILILELFAILLTGTHERELIEARLAYEIAWNENQRLNAELVSAERGM